MHLVLVPQALDETNPLFPVRHPVLPASLERPHGWGQASSHWQPDSKQLLWVRATSLELDAIAAAPGSRVVGRCAPDADGDRMVEAMEEGDRISSCLEFVDAYRAIAVAEEDSLRRQRGVARARYLAGVVGVLGAATWLALWLRLPVMEALTILLGTIGSCPCALVAHHADDFQRANIQNIGTQGGPEGQHFSDAKGRWWVDRAGVDIVDTANVGFRDNVACRAWDNRCPVIDEGRAEALADTAICGVACRMAASVQYSFRWNGSATQLHKNQYGTQLGSNGTNAAAGDKLGIYAKGTSIQGELNDSVVVGPVTDSDNPTGRLGVIGDGTTPDVVVGKLRSFNTQVPYEAVTAHPIEFVGAGTEGSAASGNVTPGIPSDLRVDDILICTVHSSDQVSHSMTGDWTQIVQGNGGGTTSRLSVWYHRWTGTAPSALVTHSGGQSPIAGIVAYRGCKKSGSPVDVVSSILGGTDGSIEHQGIFPSLGAFILLINGAADDNTRTIVSGYSSRYVDGSFNCFITTAGTPDGSVCVMDRAAPGGPTGDVTMTQSASDAWASVFLSLKPEDQPVDGAEPALLQQAVARGAHW